MSQFCDLHANFLFIIYIYIKSNETFLFLNKNKIKSLIIVNYNSILNVIFIVKYHIDCIVVIY